MAGPQINKSILGNNGSKNKKNGEVNYPDRSNDRSRKIYTIKAENWDKNFPYFIDVLLADSEDGRVILDDSNRVSDFDRFVLPINPNNISVSVPFAINVMATTRGILEEHNGTVFRNIVIQGTTGVTPIAWSNNAASNQNIQSNSAKIQTRLGSVRSPAQFGGPGGAIAVAQNTNVANAVNVLRNIINSTGDLPILKSAIDQTQLWSLGHAQLHQLANYLVSYSELKKKGGNEEAVNARLVFGSIKDNTFYVCTPISFDINKTSENPHMWTYRLVLRAWDLAQPGSDIGPTKNIFGVIPITQDNNKVSELFNNIREARAIISASINVVKSVASDFETFYQVVRETMLMVKDLGELGNTLADFPELIATRWKFISRDFNNRAEELREEFSGNDSSQRTKNILRSLTAISGSANTTILTSPADNASLSPTAGEFTAQQETNQKKFDIQNPFNSSNNIISNTDFLDEFNLDDFSLTSQEEELIDEKVNELRRLTITDIDIRRREIEEVRDAFADSRGLGDISYNNAVDRTISVQTIETFTTGDLKIIESFNDIIRVLDSLGATNDFVRQTVPDPFVRAQDAVQGSGIVIRSANVAFPVPFPFNGSLEQLALQHFGNPDRWIEIARLNDLKPPFIDEDGFFRFFTTSGSGNQFTIDNATNLFLGQEIFLSTDFIRPERRTIIRIDELAEDNFLITVSGNKNLEQYIVGQKAKLRAFLPNTVNSSKIIFIPIDGEVPEINENLPDTREIPIVADLDKQQRLMGVDIAITDDFDLALTNSGDLQLTAGFNNAIQALKIKMAVEQGSLKRHPEFGAGLNVGEKARLTAEQIRTILEQNILNDDRFDEILDINVEFDGPIVRLNVRVRVTNGGGVVPIQFIL